MIRNRFPTALYALLVVAAVFYAIFVGRSAFRVDGQMFFTLIDDAMISMRYAQHLATGSGLTWNVGEQPVQGFTNLGWILPMALLHLLPFSQATISLGLMGVAAACLLLHVVVVWRICQEISPTARHAPFMAAGITALYFPLVFWSLRGMEVGLLVLLLDLAVLLLIKAGRGGWKESVILGLLLAGATLVRMDAVLQATVILIYAASAGRMGRKQVATATLIAGMGLAGILAFQYSYFGDVLPNTFYQKVVGASTGERLKNGILVFNDYAVRDLAMLAVVSAAGLGLYGNMRSRQTSLLAALFAIQCLYSIWIGGDYAEPEVASANRFITQGMPALIILFATAVDRLLQDVLAASSSPVIPIAGALATLLVISGTPWLNWAIDNAPLLKADVRRVRAGLAIAENTSPEASIAVHAAGQIPYYSGRKAIDLLGLNDAVIAKGPRSTDFYPGHDKWNYDYSIGELQPDLIADNWIRLGEYIRGRPDYRQLPNGMYLRVGTTLVDEAGLLSAFP
jgi:hypothetical protein